MLSTCDRQILQVNLKKQLLTRSHLSARWKSTKNIQSFRLNTSLHKIWTYCCT